MAGAKICVMDPRLSQHRVDGRLLAAALAGHRGRAAAGHARTCILREGTWDREFVRRWVNWSEYLREERPDAAGHVRRRSRTRSRRTTPSYTPEFAETRERACPPRAIEEVAREIGRAGGAFATHVWRSAAAGNLRRLAGRARARAPDGAGGSVGTPGGTAPSAWNKSVPTPPMMPPPGQGLERAPVPARVAARHFEMSFLLPHFLKEGRGKLAMYFTRVYNPVWTNPDGMTWIEMLHRRGQGRACTPASRPTWSETAWFADYVLPMGHASERHDLMSQETHAARWIGFRQPVLRVALEQQGKTLRLDLAGARGGRARAGVGGGRVLDRAVLAHRPRRRARHPQVLRVALPARREAAHRRVLPLDLREQRARAARGGRSARA